MLYKRYLFFQCIMIGDIIASLIMIDLLNAKTLKFMGFGIKFFIK